MELPLNRYRNLTVLLLVVIGQLLLLAYQVKNNQDVRVIRVWAVSVVTPLARVLEFVRRNTIGIAEDYVVLVHVRDENVRLGKENGRLKLDNQYLRNELSTADRVKALRVFQERTPSRTLAARVIGNGTGANSQVVFIDRGSGSGILKGMPVVTPDGIVGKVLGAYPTASQVLLITDPNFAAGVVSQKNHVHGTLVGFGQSKCIVKYIQNEEKVEPGEMFYTSGDDRLFPKGMPAGRATVVRQGRDFKEIFVEPSGWTSGLEEVLVVMEGVHQEIPDAPPAASAEVYMQAPPPVDTKQAQAQANAEQPLYTEADKLREKYKKIGAAQGHVFGEGTPGSKPPDFNVDPDAAAKAAAAKAAAAKAAASAPPVQQPPTVTPQLDANGKPIQAKPRPVQPRLDANGNPVNPAPRPVQPPRLDANGNPITPAARPAQQQPRLDANGNPITPAARPVQQPRFDANGNPITPAVRPAQQQPRLDANGNPIPQNTTPRPALDANGNPVRKPAVNVPASRPPATGVAVDKVPGRTVTQAKPAAAQSPRPGTAVDADGRIILAKPVAGTGAASSPNGQPGTATKKTAPVSGASATTPSANQVSSRPKPPAVKAPTVTSDKTTINITTPPPGSPKPAQKPKPAADQDR